MEKVKRPGRPAIEIDPKKFKSLCEIQCTAEEIAAVMGCSHDTLERWCKREYKKTFREVFNELRCGGKASLRRKQWALAGKNAAVAIWLGKQYLGQKDEQTVNQNIAPIVIKDDLGD